MHVAEVKEEIEFAQATRGTSTVQHLGRLGVLDNNFLAVHTVWLTDDEIQLFADNNVKVSHNPAAAMRVLGFAHITGGGIAENLIRIIPKTCKVVIEKESWDVPPIFSFLQKAGNISHKEMLRTFNNGIGLIAVVPQKAVQDVLERLNAMNEKAFLIGKVIERKNSRTQIKWI